MTLTHLFALSWYYMIDPRRSFPLYSALLSQGKGNRSQRALDPKLPRWPSGPLLTLGLKGSCLLQWASELGAELFPLPNPAGLCTRIPGARRRCNTRRRCNRAPCDARSLYLGRGATASCDARPERSPKPLN